MHHLNNCVVVRAASVLLSVLTWHSVNAASCMSAGKGRVLGNGPPMQL